MTPRATLTHDEHKASEAAFHGLPLDPKWSKHAQEIYLGILDVTNGKDIVNKDEAPERSSPGRGVFELMVRLAR